MGDVVDFNGVTTLDIEPRKVLEQALKWHEEFGPFKRVLVIGVPESHPNARYYGMSDADAGVVIWDMQRLERALHAEADSQMDD